MNKQDHGNSKVVCATEKQTLNETEITRNTRISEMCQIVAVGFFPSVVFEARVARGSTSAGQSASKADWVYKWRWCHHPTAFYKIKISYKLVHRNKKQTNWQGAVHMVLILKWAYDNFIVYRNKRHYKYIIRMSVMFEFSVCACQIYI